MAPVPEGSVYDYGTKGGRRWGFILDAPGPDGRRRQIRRQGFATRGAARDALDGLRAELRAGRVPVPDDGTFAGFTVGWLAALPAEGIEPSTVRHYRECVERLVPTIGDVALQALTGLDLDRAYGALRAAGRSARTIRSSHIAVKKMLGEAERLGVVAGNVAGAARPPRARSTRPKRFPTWTLDETYLFLEATGTDPLAACWWTMAFTGMRRGEAVALRWSDVDLDRGVLTVARAFGVDSARAVFVKTPKSDAGHRQVELDDDTVAVLRAHRRRQVEFRMAVGAGWRNRDELVFVEVDGSLIHPERLSDRWRILVKRAPGLSLQRIRLHDLRHSHATQLLVAGTRPDVVTKRLGHSSVAFTLQTYGHVYDGDQRTAMSTLLARRRGARDSAVTGSGPRRPTAG